MIFIIIVLLIIFKFIYFSILSLLIISYARYLLIIIICSIRIIIIDPIELLECEVGFFGGLDFRSLVSLRCRYFIRNYLVMYDVLFGFFLFCESWFPYYLLFITFNGWMLSSFLKIVHIFFIFISFII
jgi:hypothetical protein